MVHRNALPREATFVTSFCLPECRNIFQKEVYSKGKEYVTGEASVCFESRLKIRKGANMKTAELFPRIVY